MKTGKEELIEVENRIEKVLGKLPSMPSIQTLEDQLAVSVFHFYFYNPFHCVFETNLTIVAILWNECTVPDFSKLSGPGCNVGSG
jgi:hypothetical protein